MLCIALADNTEEICNPLHCFLRSMGSRNIYQHLFPAVCSIPRHKINYIKKFITARGYNCPSGLFSIILSLPNFSLIYFSGTQLGTDLPALFLFPTFSYPSQQGSAFFDVAAFFVAAFLGAAFFVVAIKMFMKQNQRISQNILIKNYLFNLWQFSQMYVALLPLPM